MEKKGKNLAETENVEEVSKKSKVKKSLEVTKPSSTSAVPKLKVTTIIVKEQPKKTPASIKSHSIKKT